MQQRTSSSTSRYSGEHRAINVAEQPQTKRRRTDGDMLGLPLYDPRSTGGKRGVSLLRSAEKWLHAIPVIVLLCLFILWWYSFPVNVTVRDGRTTDIHQIDTPLPNTTRIDITILAVSAIPMPSVPENLSSDNETYLPLVSEASAPN